MQDHSNSPLEAVRFTQEAWAKYEHLCKRMKTEIGFFGLTPENDPFLIQQIVIPKQEVTAVSVDFDDEGLADHLESCILEGLEPWQCMRWWLHTHPGNSASPSSTDWSTWSKAFGNCDWSGMIILAKGGDTSCHFRKAVNIQQQRVVLEAELDIEIETSTSFEETQWEDEAMAMCSTPLPAKPKNVGQFPKTYYGAGAYGLSDFDEANFYNEEFKKGNMK